MNTSSHEPHMTASISPQLHKSVLTIACRALGHTHTTVYSHTKTLDVLERLSDQYMERDAVLPGADVLRDALGSNGRCAPWWSGMR